MNSQLLLCCDMLMVTRESVLGDDAITWHDDASHHVRSENNDWPCSSIRKRARNICKRLTPRWYDVINTSITVHIPVVIRTYDVIHFYVIMIVCSSKKNSKEPIGFIIIKTKLLMNFDRGCHYNWMKSVLYERAAHTKVAPSRSGWSLSRLSTCIRCGMQSEKAKG